MSENDEWIARNEFGVVLGPQAVIEQQIEAALRAQAEMVIAFRADLPIRLQIFFPDDGAAGVALDPQAFGADAALIDGRRVLDPFFVALEPGHASSRFLAARGFPSCTDA